MKKITLLIALMITSLGFSQSFPLNFTDPAQVLVGQESTTSIVNDGGNNVCQIVGGGLDFDNAQKDLALKINLSNDANNTITFRIKPINGTGSGRHLLKFEGGGQTELAFSTTGTDWQNISLNFPAGLGSYTKFVLFTDVGLPGPNAAIDTYWVDDFAGGTNDVIVGTPITSLNVDFETPTIFSSFDGAAFTNQVNNDVTNGINASAKAGQVANINASLYANTQYQVPSGIDLSTGNMGFSMMVKGPRAIPVLFKVEGGTSSEVSANYTTPGVWQKLTFNFSSNTSKNNTFFLFFMDITGPPSGTASNDVFLIDNVVFGTFASLSTTKFDRSTVKMYPNPVQNTLTIEANSEIQRVSVYNVLGQEVLSRSPKSNSTTLQTNDLQKGVYMVTTEIDGNISSSKIVKE